MNLIIYPELEQRMEENGLAQRIKEADIGYPAHEHDPSVFINQMDGDDFYAHVDPRQVHQIYALVDAYLNEQAFWDIDKEPKAGLFPEWVYSHQHLVKSEDFPILVGWYAADVLTPEEMGQPKNFGFTNSLEMFGAIGAYHVVKRTIPERGKVWFTEHEKRIWRNVITGDMHADMRIFQDDITAYKVLDPFGNVVQYRPLLNEDRRMACPYHSVETQLMRALLKHLEATDIPSVVRDKEKCFELVTRVCDGTHGQATCAEHVMPNRLSTSVYRLAWPNGTCDFGEYYGHLPMQGDATYFILPDGDNLMLRRSDDATPRVIYLGSEIDNVFEGLLHQAASNLGRTNVDELIDMLNYWHSEQYLKDLETK